MPLRLSLWAYGPGLAGSPLWVRVACLLAVAALCIAAAAVAQRWFELPCQRLARRVLGEQRPSLTTGGLHRRPPASAHDTELVVVRNATALEA